MNINELAKLDERMAKEARKWISYLETCSSKEEKETELKRKLIETYLEGKIGG